MSPSPKPDIHTFPSDSNVLSASYRPEHQTLTVHFRSQPLKPYHHSGVTPELFDNWKKWTAAGYSAGQFYHSHIKRHLSHSLTPA